MLGNQMFSKMFEEKKINENEDDSYYALVSGYFVKPACGGTEVDICSFIHTDKEGHGIFDDIETIIEEFYEDGVEGNDFMVLVKSRWGDRIDEDDVEIVVEVTEVKELNTLKEEMEKMPKEKLIYGFIVEGLHDKDIINRLVDRAWVVVTEGTRFNNRVFNDIEEMIESVDKVYVLTDPDEAGDKIASTIMEKYTGLERIELNPEQCKCWRNNKLKIGFEHTSDEYAKEVLRRYIEC